MKFQLKNHMMEVSIIIGALIFFYLSLPFQMSLILLFLCISTLGLLAMMRLSADLEIEQAPARVIIEDDSQSNHYPYYD